MWENLTTALLIISHVCDTEWQSEIKGIKHNNSLLSAPSELIRYSTSFWGSTCTQIGYHWPEKPDNKSISKICNKRASMFVLNLKVSAELEGASTPADQPGETCSDQIFFVLVSLISSPLNEHLLTLQSSGMWSRDDLWQCQYHFCTFSLS